jgi:gamma-glutamylcyclotransferase (GGCT)/AIG2-like uncharacterized protein YtfP
MLDRVFFYGTLRTGFSRRPSTGIDSKLTYVGHGTVHAALFDLGLYPAAIPAPDSRVRGEVHVMADPEAVLAVLDEIEGYRASEPERSLYVRAETTVTLDGGREETAWVYFYNAPLAQAPRIVSGDYLEHLVVREEREPN